jgi:uncharacterized protein (TIGR02996 family)
VVFSADESALMESIASAPLDDAPKLVYADWLEEHDADEKAEYVRIVVKLMHPPEEHSVVDRCMELAKTLESNWRQAVGGFFEVTLGGGRNLTLFFLSCLVPGLKVEDYGKVEQQKDSLRLRRSLTREDAEAFVKSFGGSAMGRLTEGRLILVIRPMASPTPPQLFAPDDERN